ncbi:hypothetical protein ACOMHN_027454 [Nucella lapillus]
MSDYRNVGIVKCRTIGPDPTVSLCVLVQDRKVVAISGQPLAVRRRSEWLLAAAQAVHCAPVPVRNGVLVSERRSTVSELARRPHLWE